MSRKNIGDEEDVKKRRVPSDEPGSGDSDLDELEESGVVDVEERGGTRRATIGPEGEVVSRTRGRGEFDVSLGRSVSDLSKEEFKEAKELGLVRGTESEFEKQKRLKELEEEGVLEESDGTYKLDKYLGDLSEEEFGDIRDVGFDYSEEQYDLTQEYGPKALEVLRAREELDFDETRSEKEKAVLEAKEKVDLFNKFSEEEQSIIKARGAIREGFEREPGAVAEAYTPKKVTGAAAESRVRRDLFGEGFEEEDRTLVERATGIAELNPFWEKEYEVPDSKIPSPEEISPFQRSATEFDDYTESVREYKSSVSSYGAKSEEAREAFEDVKETDAYQKAMRSRELRERANEGDLSALIQMKGRSGQREWMGFTQELRENIPWEVTEDVTEAALGQPRDLIERIKPGGEPREEGDLKIPELNAFGLTSLVGAEDGELQVSTKEVIGEESHDIAEAQEQVFQNVFEDPGIFLGGGLSQGTRAVEEIGSGEADVGDVGDVGGFVGEFGKKQVEYYGQYPTQGVVILGGLGLGAKSAVGKISQTDFRSKIGEMSSKISYKTPDFLTRNIDPYMTKGGVSDVNLARRNVRLKDRFDTTEVYNPRRTQEFSKKINVEDVESGSLTKETVEGINEFIEEGEQGQVTKFRDLPENIRQDVVKDIKEIKAVKKETSPGDVDVSEGEVREGIEEYFETRRIDEGQEEVSLGPSERGLQILKQKEGVTPIEILKTDEGRTVFRKPKELESQFQETFGESGETLEQADLDIREREARVEAEKSEGFYSDIQEWVVGEKGSLDLAELGKQTQRGRARAREVIGDRLRGTQEGGIGTSFGLPTDLVKGAGYGGALGSKFETEGVGVSGVETEGVNVGEFGRSFQTDLGPRTRGFEEPSTMTEKGVEEETDLGVDNVLLESSLVNQVTESGFETTPEVESKETIEPKTVLAQETDFGFDEETDLGFDTEKRRDDVMFLGTAESIDLDIETEQDLDTDEDTQLVAIGVGGYDFEGYETTPKPPSPPRSNVARMRPRDLDFGDEPSSGSGGLDLGFGKPEAKAGGLLEPGWLSETFTSMGLLGQRKPTSPEEERLEELDVVGTDLPTQELLSGEGETEEVLELFGAKGTEGGSWFEY